ncbi:hypothetical protein B0H13DRAFT_1906528 [Mycena leptocephala]|nr:hypothetical protein B0H13DRAFT_1906528 [Mycena leptocephala]
MQRDTRRDNTETRSRQKKECGDSEEGSAALCVEIGGAGRPSNESKGGTGRVDVKERVTRLIRAKQLLGMNTLVGRHRGRGRNGKEQCCGDAWAAGDGEGVHLVCRVRTREKWAAVGMPVHGGT